MKFSLASIAPLRLRNQWINAPVRTDAASVVRHLVAVQSQDFAGAKWALGLRLQGGREAQIEKAFNEGQILRTHVLRPTWHFVSPTDIGWLLRLTGPRVQAANAGMYRKAGLDAATFRKADKVLEAALRGGKHRTREELRLALHADAINASNGLRATYVLMHAELEGLICSGPRRGKQFTYALLAERAPTRSTPSRDEALSELTRRYFLSRGPATAHDFSKWSGLTLADCRTGLESVRRQLQSATLDGQVYWFGETDKPPRSAHTAHLLSVYDEYVSSYKGHTAMATEDVSRRLRAFGTAVTGIIVFDGQVIGTWKRTLSAQEADIRLRPFRSLTSEERGEVLQAADRFAAFHGVRAATA
jgi:hypothetical protein